MKNKLNKLDASIVYQRALKSDKKFSVQVITGNDYDRIDEIVYTENKNTANCIFPDSYGANMFKRTAADVSLQICSMLTEYPGFTKIYLCLPETGMCLDEQRYIVINALKTMVEHLPDADEISLIIWTNSPFVISDCTAGNLTIVRKGSESTIPEFGHGTKDLLAGNLYDIHVTVQDNGSCIGECGRAFIQCYLDKKNSPEDLTEEDKNAVDFIGDAFIAKQVKRIMFIH